MSHDKMENIAYSETDRERLVVFLFSFFFSFLYHKYKFIRFCIRSFFTPCFYSKTKMSDLSFSSQRSSFIWNFVNFFRFFFLVLSALRQSSIAKRLFLLVASPFHVFFSLSFVIIKCGLKGCQFLVSQELRISCSFPFVVLNVQN